MVDGIWKFPSESGFLGCYEGHVNGDRSCVVRCMYEELAVLSSCVLFTGTCLIRYAGRYQMSESAQGNRFSMAITNAIIDSYENPISDF